MCVSLWLDGQVCSLNCGNCMGGCLVCTASNLPGMHRVKCTVHTIHVYTLTKHIHVAYSHVSCRLRQLVGGL